MARYSFGDDDSAVRRLRLVADAYEPVSRAFLSENAPQGVPVAVDLGCGPGFSTRLLGEVCQPGELVGIDSSESFVGVARAAVPKARFLTLDLKDPARELPPAGVIYARLLLAHLPDPLGAVERWKGALGPNGVLLVEDLDHVEAPAGPLQDYEELSSGVVQRAGGVMYAGRALEPHGGHLTRVTVPETVAAEVYLFNVERWLAEEDIGVPKDVLLELAADLKAVRRAGGAGEVSWVVRQVVVVR